MKFSFTLPTILTLFRLIFSLFFLPVILVNFIPYNSLTINCVLTIIFILVAITDLLDGYFARKLGLESEMGKVLDPIADKFMFYSTLVALLAVDRIFYFWVIIFIGREFFIMGLRTVALQNGFSVSVSFLGKLKTVFQLSYLALVIFNPTLLANPYSTALIVVQNSMLALALALTIASAYNYYLTCIEMYRMRIVKDGD